MTQIPDSQLPLTPSKTKTHLQKLAEKRRLRKADQPKRVLPLSFPLKALAVKQGRDTAIDKLKRWYQNDAEIEIIRQKLTGAGFYGLNNFDVYMYLWHFVVKVKEIPERPGTPLELSVTEFEHVYRAWQHHVKDDVIMTADYPGQDLAKRKMLECFGRVYRKSRKTARFEGVEVTTDLLSHGNWIVVDGKTLFGIPAEVFREQKFRKLFTDPHFLEMLDLFLANESGDSVASPTVPDGEGACLQLPTEVSSGNQPAESEADEYKVERRVEPNYEESENPDDDNPLNWEEAQQEYLESHPLPDVKEVLEQKEAEKDAGLKPEELKKRMRNILDD